MLTRYIFTLICFLFYIKPTFSDIVNINNEQIKEINQWREKKRKIIVIDAEGNQQSKTFVTKMTFKPDLCFLWSNVEFQRHKEKIMSELK